MLDGVDDVLAANLTLAGVRLLGSDPQRDGFKRIANSVIIEDPAPSPAVALRIPGQGDIELAPTKMRMPKERITLDLVPGRSIIAMEYPSFDDIPILADVIRKALERSDVEGDRQQPQAYGFNIESTYKLRGQTAIEFIASHIFAKGLFQDGSGYSLIGGSPQVQVMYNERLWNITIQPFQGKGDGDKVLVSLNLHVASTKMPSPREAREGLMAVWAHAHQIPETLNGGVTIE